MVVCTFMNQRNARFVNALRLVLGKDPIPNTEHDRSCQAEEDELHRFYPDLQPWEMTQCHGGRVLPKRHAK